MKQFYKSINLRRLSLVFVVLFSVFSLVISCKNNDDDEPEFKDYLVRFEAKIIKGTGTADGTFKTVVTQVGTVQNTIFNPTGTTWSSGEFFVNSSQSQLNLDANAILANADSELIVTIYIDGEVAKTAKVIGTGVKSASVDYSFLEL